MKTDELTEGALHERRFGGAAERLRAPERVARLDVPRVVALSLEDLALESVLDVGTGTGIFAEAFANIGLAVMGIDTNAELLTRAREYAPPRPSKKRPQKTSPSQQGRSTWYFSATCCTRPMIL